MARRTNLFRMRILGVPAWVVALAGLAWWKTRPTPGTRESLTPEELAAGERARQKHLEELGRPS